MSSGKRSRASDPEQDPENGEEGSPDEDLGQGSKARRLRARRPTAKGSQSGSQKSGTFCLCTWRCVLRSGPCLTVPCCTGCRVRSAAASVP
eukprot:scaffold1717_cov377-Prasinococcus_capsulatus_cf.AAC.3